MSKIGLLIFLMFMGSIHIVCSQDNNAEKFWNILLEHCGMAYEGEIVEGGKEGDGFTGKKLLMHVRSCEDNRIRIPFFVGDDKSRTWVLTLEEGQLKLKHDHRLVDGSEDAITQYGGVSTNSGHPNLQFFPADQETANLIEYAAHNVWWITIDDSKFTYNLRRIGTDRLFSVAFDLTTPVSAPEAPWGWKE
ncbi:hypothetical protein [Imtechella halotolerans]|uniref:Secreted protein n=1 Tax=Imtechella halotolerans K1 TaxID=946077 RepID=I0WJS4_9FLAO|nr:hypothetical protein [Imtechella halotolerans]EID76640.1 hypothetical protein W5A_01415 [Imtechella halotolerans K1]WMQ62791.1 hypothetical protein PT603_10670 [Imtechella halotolerans]